MLGLLRVPNGDVRSPIVFSTKKCVGARIIEIATQGVGAVATSELPDAPAAPQKRTTKKAADAATADAEDYPSTREKKHQEKRVKSHWWNQGGRALNGDHTLNSWQ
jgi:acyl-CoA hydrolase